MKKFIPNIITAFVFLFLIQGYAEAQQVPEFLKDPQYRSSREYRKSAEADGNRVWITFENTGYLAGVGEIRGQWPRGSGVNYIGDVSPVLSMEIPVDMNNDGVADTLVQHSVTTPGDRTGQGPRPGETEVWAFEPMPGFANMDGENDRPAISTDESTWPDRWPDQPSWIKPNGSVEWNGFFGRGIQNADFETYFWADDHNDRFMQDEYGFRPDSTDPTRGGQGLAMSVRGLQWSQFLAQDAMFYIYEITNTSTTTYPRVSVGLVVGTAAGEPASTASGDTQDDLAFFDQGNRIVYSWDANGEVNTTGDPVGYVGYAFMESPGDPNDGIDNDGDGDPNKLNVEGFPYTDPSLVGPAANTQFSSQDFEPRTINEGDPIILIDLQTNERSVVYMGSEPMTVTSQGIEYELSPGITLEETQKTIQGQIDAITVTEKNLIDEDLDGIIDEDESLHSQRRFQELDGSVSTYAPLRFKNFVGLAEAVGEGGTPTQQDSLDYGLLNPMVDESPQDGIDNDGDWSVLTDDVGADGVSGTGDQGEGDGRPTRGEPNFEHLDVDETDQVGLSSFYYFTPPTAVNLGIDQQVWDAMSPGFFTTNNELSAQQPDGVDGDFIFSSGYFRLEPGQTLRFSLALVYGEDLANITSNVQTIQEIYDRNYNFARPPEKPTLKAAVGDERVTLYWNSLSEESEDPILGKDFEGYKIFKSTDPNFLDPDRITDAFGNDALLEPIAQFDLDNGINGLWQPAEDTSTVGNDPSYVYNPDLADRVRGVPFYLGDDTGLKHSFVDTNVVNGQTYYYALAAYDRGSVEFYPAQNNFSVAIKDDGSAITDINVVEVEPNTPVLGYQSGDVTGEVEHANGEATGQVFVEVIDPAFLKENSGYEVRFTGASFNASTFSVVNNGDIIVSDASLEDAEAQIFDGMRLGFQNDLTRYNPDASGWADDDTTKIRVNIRSGTFVNQSRWKFSGTPSPFDYELIFADQNVATSLDTTLGTGSNAIDVPATNVNFRIVNTTTGENVDFAFDESLGDENGELGDDEYIYIYDKVADDSVAATYEITYEYQNVAGQGSVPTGDLPEAGDTFEIRTYKSFGSGDKYSFTTKSSKVDEETAQEMLDEVRVVPNPYVSAASWEGKLPPTITSGRGERKVQFQNVPANSTIRIFTSRGELVRELTHEDGIDRGYVDWDLRSRENLDVAYGIYFYHLEAPGVGTKTGKIALIK